MALFGPKNGRIGSQIGPIFQSFLLFSDSYHGPTPGFTGLTPYHLSAILLMFYDNEKANSHSPLAIRKKPL